MVRKCFISFKTEDMFYKKFIQENLKMDIIDKSLNIPIPSQDPDYIMRRIREDYLSDSTVTLHLIGGRSSELWGWDEQQYIKREMQASLYNGSNNTRNGILGIVLPNMYNLVYTGDYRCISCNCIHNIINISDSTVIKEFSYNYYLPNDKCAYWEDDRYCVLVKWDDFIINPNQFIEQAFLKRTSKAADKVKVRPS